MTLASNDTSVRRREFLCGGGAAVLNAMLAALLGDAKPAHAAPISGSVPEIDRVTVTVVVDNYQFAVAPSTKVGNIDIQRFGWGLGDKPPSKTLISEFGCRCMLNHNAARKRGASS
jgi:7,8-dihydropterin-6-yl-methyl-4-(beta-D-ribofuranosyl)aminobenzene 5'-phosphate synthase